MSGHDLDPNGHYSDEAGSVERSFGVDLADLTDEERENYQLVVAIAQQFTRPDARSGKPAIISPSRTLAIPAITARYCELVRPARGSLSSEQIIEAWQSNIPQDYGRHPDQLFDIAQFNFGTDEPTGDIVRELNRVERRRKELVERYKAAAWRVIDLRQRDLRINDEDELRDRVDEAVENYVDRVTIG